MAKSERTTNNLLRLSGMIFTVVGSFHVLRYFIGWEFNVGGFQLTRLGSLILGGLLLLLAWGCFANSRK